MSRFIAGFHSWIREFVSMMNPARHAKAYELACSTQMLLGLLKLPWSAFTRGEIHGMRVTRNPIAWIPFFVLLPIAIAFLLIIGALHILLLPFIAVWGYVCLRSFQRKAGVFTDAGVHFPHAYSKLTIAWSDIREVVREREPKVIFYRIICAIDPQPLRGYIMSSTPDDEAFERTLKERGIPYRVHDPFDEAQNSS